MEQMSLVSDDEQEVRWVHVAAGQAVSGSIGYCSQPSDTNARLLTSAC